MSELQNLKLVRGTKSKVEQTTLEANNLYLVDNEFEGNKLLQSTESGDIVEANTVQMVVTFSDGTQGTFKIAG